MMGLFVPLLLGGLALTGLPWLIHRIRKPTRNPTPFSSLMFMPKTVPPVRDKKQIEHPWLMLLRMLMLVVAALAFARPYIVTPVAAEGEEPADRQHVILVDVSLSANAGGQFEAVRKAAAACLARIGSGEPVGVVAFNATPEVLAPLSTLEDSGAGSHGRAEAAIASLAPTVAATQFVPALQTAEQLLRPPGQAEGEEEEEKERIIHLVSDLQRTGLPEEAARYALGRGISLKLIPVAPLEGGNQAVEAIALDARRPSTLYVRTRLRNYSDAKAQGLLQIWLDGEKKAEEPVTLLPDSNTVFPLAVETDLGQTAAGEVRLVAEDVLLADNVLYFVYEPEPIREIGVFIDPNADRSAPNRFLEAAVAESQPLPWRLVPVEAEMLAEAADTLPEVLVLPEVGPLPEAVGSSLADYVERGGRVLLIPSTNGFSPEISERLLATAGVVSSGPKLERVVPGEYATMNWIDFDHPVFRAFRSAAYSDFSMVRFENYHRLEVQDAADVTVLARLDADGAAAGNPAALVFEAEAGVVAAWAFPLDPAWTNITRTRRFIPMLHETLSLLLPPLPSRRVHFAGTRPGGPPDKSETSESIRVQWPGADEATSFNESQSRRILTATGHLRWFNNEASAAVTEPVNLNPSESDLRVFSAEEFLLRLGAVSQDVTEAAASAPDIEHNVVHWEYGYYVLVALAAAGLMETFLAVHYGRKATLERQTS